MKRMAKVGFILLCVFSISIVLNSCSKESTNERRIVGKWVVTSHIKSYYNAEDGTLHHGPIDLSDGNVGGVTEFYSDGTSSWDGILFIKYSLDGNVLLLGEGVSVTKYVIVELTNSTLILERQSGIEHAYDGTPVYTVWHTEYEKQ